jgi:hypothetical protein
MDFQYGLRARPPAPGAVPKGYISHEKDTKAVGVRHGVLTYPKALSDAEVRQYELVPLTDKSGNSLVLPFAPLNLVKDAKEAAEQLTYVAKEGLDEADESVKEVVDAAKAALERLRAWCRHSGYKAEDAIDELKLPKSMLLSYRILSPGSAPKLPSTNKVLPLIEEWVHGADADLGVKVKVGYHQWLGREHNYTVFSFDLREVLGQISFTVVAPRQLEPHAILSPAIRGNGITAFIYRLMLDKGFILATDGHTQMARNVWDKLSKAGYIMELRGDNLTLRRRNVTIKDY